MTDANPTCCTACLGTHVNAIKKNKIGKGKKQKKRKGEMTCLRRVGRSD